MHSPRVMPEREPVMDVRVLESAAAAVPLLLGELRNTIARTRMPLVGFATGNTFAAFLRALAVELDTGGLPAAFVATHLDEYQGFPPERRSGMAHELCTACPPLGAMLRAGAFVPVPHVEESKVLAAHDARLRAMGGVQLQFLGIGRNGHLAFNEPGTPFDSGFHGTDLATTTRDDARTRFAPGEPPLRAVTSGLGTILGARRIVLCAFGEAKAAAVRAMRHGPVTEACPASVLRRHPSVLVLLDRPAAG